MEIRTRRMDRRELVTEMQDRADALRHLAANPFINDRGRTALLAASDLYEARAESFRAKAS